MSDTVRLRLQCIKRKAGLRCAETVNVGNSLWKALENLAISDVQRRPPGLRPARAGYPKGQHLLPAGEMPANHYNQSCEILFDQAAQWCHHLQMHFLQAFGGDTRV
jgi:hypothetical protein